MRVISHRGLWHTLEQQNTLEAFKNSFSSEFGLETDIRDLGGQLVISHDPALLSETPLHSLLNLASSYEARSSLPLALNIKSDGLAYMLQSELAKFPGLDAFVFDMSVPDMRSYLSTGIPVYTRMSEYEKDPILLDQCDGVWLDSFEGDWFDVALVEELVALRKQVCIVSPELHKRAPEAQWIKLKDIDTSKVTLCTDFPNRAQQYFLVGDIHESD